MSGSEGSNAWLMMPAIDAARLEPIQDAASVYASNFTKKVERQIGQFVLVSEYTGSTSVATDSCARYESFLYRAPNDNVRTALFNAHVNQFGCSDLTRHAHEIIRLAKLFFGIK